MKAIALLMSVLSVAAGAEEKCFDEPQGSAAEVRKLLGDARRQALDADQDTARQISRLRSAAAKSTMLLEPHSPVWEKVKAVSEAGDRPPADELTRLETTIDRVLADLSFRPVAEADLPKGFPTYTAVGTIEVKKYPAYRMAAGSGFWTLFAHIQLNQIAMTAPVQMTYEQTSSDDLRQEGMAFLYGNREIGRTGRQGLVTVTDNDPQVVVSLGLRGDRSASVVKDAEERLDKWIDSSPRFERAGELRVMGYNSPYVPKEKQYFEVQIPIKPVAGSE